MRQPFKIAFSLLLLAVSMGLQAQPLSQKKSFTRQDTLRGTITPERAWYNVHHYAITVEPDAVTKTIEGSNVILYSAESEGQIMQIDLQEPMQLVKATQDNRQLTYKRDGNIFLVDLGRKMAKGEKASIKLEFAGKPREAKRPPWDGGWIWSKDEAGFPWMSVACQGLGASVWYPNKDHQSDEVDSASLTIIAPNSLMAVGNGRLRSTTDMGRRKAYTWVVTNPINNYNIVPYIGKYVNFSETFDGEKGKLDCSYWVIDQNLEKAKVQFQQVKPMLQCFEHWFGPYPFYEDGYKLVESPHLGMEHQSAVAYGNKYQNGYLGNDLSGTGHGNEWDFIIIHESGHEWFANNITTKDIADMWVHEGFTNYSETIYTGCKSGIPAGNAYVIGTRTGIENDIPIIGHYGVNQEGSGDMYSKAGNMLHTIRQMINDDEKFRMILRGLNKDFYHQTVTSAQVEKYISDKSGIDLSKVFDQYLRTVKIPVLEHKAVKGKTSIRWTNCVEGFNMKLKLQGKDEWIYPTTQWQEINLKDKLSIDPNFYILVKKG